MADNTFLVEMGEEFYSVSHAGVSGAPAPYGETACIRVNGVVYYCHIDEPDDYPEGGEAPEVYMVESAVVVPSTMEEVDDDEDEEEEEETGAAGPTLVEDEEDEDEEDQGDLQEEDEDENLPPAEDQR